MTNPLPTTDTPRPARVDAATPLIRSAAVAVFSGFLTGVITLGLGARLAMRIVALLASDADQGQLTDAEAVVGEVTVGGTVFLALLGGAAGTFGGVLYALTRHRLAWAGRWRGLAFGSGALIVLGSALVEGANPDFSRFGTPLVNVAMFGSLFVFFGIVIAPVYHNMQRAVPAAKVDVAGSALSLVQILGLVLMLPATLIVVAALSPESGVSALILLVTLAYLMVLAPAAPLTRRFRPAAGGADLRCILTGVAPLIPALAVGLALDVNELIAIL